MNAHPALVPLVCAALALTTSLRSQDPDRDLPWQRVMMAGDSCVERGIELLAAGWSWRAAGLFREVVTQQPERPLGHLLLALAVRDAPNHAARRCWDAVSRLAAMPQGAERAHVVDLVAAYQAYFGVDSQPELKDLRFVAAPPPERAERLVERLEALGRGQFEASVREIGDVKGIAARLAALERARLATPPPLQPGMAWRAFGEQNAFLNTTGEMPFLVAGHAALLAQALEGERDRDLWLARVPRHPSFGQDAGAPAMPLPGLRATPTAAHWLPRTAPGFDLPRGLGGSDSFADHAGKPLLVVFFLGFGCEHCVAQLVELDPLAPKFRAGGIEVVTIGTDDENAVKAAHQVALENGGDPLHFDVLCDPKAETFRRWGVYDEFTKEPLHGTFLVDAQGRILWQDVSVRPFDDSAWLLAESQRLLVAWR